MTQGFGENDGNVEAGCRGNALEVAVEGVACILTQGSGGRLRNRVLNDIGQSPQ